MSLKERYEIIKEFSLKFRNEIINKGVYILQNNCEIFEILSGQTIYPDEYISFMNSISDDAFVGNMLSELYRTDNINKMKKVLDGEATYEELFG